jgi:hypothetical protein
MKERLTHSMNRNFPDKIWIVIYSVALFIAMTILIIKTMEYS